MSVVENARNQLVSRGSWSVDPAYSTIEFRVKYMMIQTVRGRFRDFEGAIVAGDEPSVSGSIRVASLETLNEERDAHLRSPDFFDAAQFPELSFESTSIEALDDEEFRITGRLTIHGVTNDIVLHADYQGTDIDPYGNERVGLEVTGQLSRGDYDMKFNQALGSGNVLVADKVKLALDISAVKQSA